MNQYLLDPESFDSKRVLAVWGRKLPGNVAVVAVSYLGDLFLQSPDGAILWFDVLEGRVSQVADSDGELQLLINQEETCEDWFLPGFLESLKRRGEKLSPGECFAWQVHPRIGGPLESSNLAPMNLIAYHSCLRPLFDLPDGTRVSGISIDGDLP